VTMWEVDQGHDEEAQALKTTLTTSADNDDVSPLSNCVTSH